MIDKELLALSEQLQKKISEQQELTKKALSSLPEGRIKTELSELLKKTSAGKIPVSSLQGEINKILSNAY